MSVATLEREVSPIFADRATPSTAPIAVAHLVNGEHYAGAERVQDLLGACLPACGFDASIVCLKPGQFPQARHAQHVRCELVPMGSRFDLRPAGQIARYVREHDIQLLHSHTPRAAMIGRVVSQMTGKPLVHHVHSPTSADSTHVWRNRLNAWIERRSIAPARAVIAVSAAMARYAADVGVRESRIHVVPNGVAVRGPLEPRSKPTGCWTLGMVALFRPRKGLEVLLESLAQLRRQGSPIQLKAIGGFESPEYEAQIRRQVEALGLQDVIHWTGFTRDVPKELRDVDLLVLPSLFGEGLPMVLLEAMAAGVPVVATRVEGVPEALRDGIDGLLAEPGSVAGLTSAISRFVSGEVDWQRLRKSAHQRQADHFSDISMARGVAAVYRTVLETA